MTDALMDAGAEAVEELWRALTKSSGAVLARHGSDPNSNAILAAGFVRAINEINKNIDPKFKTVVTMMLTR